MIIECTLGKRQYYKYFEFLTQTACTCVKLIDLDVEEYGLCTSFTRVRFRYRKLIFTVPATAFWYNDRDSLSGHAGFMYGKGTSNQIIEALLGMLRKQCFGWWIKLFKDMRDGKPDVMYFVRELFDLIRLRNKSWLRGCTDFHRVIQFQKESLRSGVY